MFYDWFEAGPACSDHVLWGPCFESIIIHCQSFVIPIVHAKSLICIFVATQDVLPGFVLCSPDNVCHTGKTFDAQIVILEYKSIICAGYSAVMHIHTSAEEITIKVCMLYLFFLYLMVYWVNKIENKTWKWVLHRGLYLPPKFWEISYLV